MITNCCCESEPDCLNPTVHVHGCFVSDGTISGGSYLPIVGATVSFVLGGTTYGPWTTDGSGAVVIGVPAAGTATFTITPPGGSHYDALTSTRSVNCFVITYAFQLIPSSGYQCGPPGCCSTPTTAPGPPYLISDITYPDTVYLSDGHGMITMTPGGITGSRYQYSGCARRMAAKGQRMVFDDSGCHYDPFDNVEVTVYYGINCGFNQDPYIDAYGWTISGWLASGTPCPYTICLLPSFPPRPYELPDCGDPLVCGEMNSLGFIVGGGCGEIDGVHSPDGIYGWCCFHPFTDCPPAAFAISGTCNFTDDFPNAPGFPGTNNGTWPGYQIYGTTAELSVTS